MPENLVNEALRRAPTPAGLIVHSDQGSQSRATRFKELLTRYYPAKHEPAWSYPAGQPLR
jgi:transposase InsO family protein